jgi:biotin operon repressor
MAMGQHIGKGERSVRRAVAALRDNDWIRVTMTVRNNLYSVKYPDGIDPKARNKGKCILIIGSYWDDLPPETWGNGQAFRLFLHIASRLGRSQYYYASNAEIGRRIGCSADAVAEAVLTLQRNHVIEVDNRGKRKGYRIMDPAPAAWLRGDTPQQRNAGQRTTPIIRPTPSYAYEEAPIPF